MYKNMGLTLMEVLVTLVIILILSLLITPAYRDYLVKSNRSDAFQSLLAIQVAQERYRLNNTNYATNLSQLGLTTNSSNNYYTMGLTASTNSYTITANAGTNQTADTGCTSLTLTYLNGTITKTPASCWQ